MPPQPKLQKQNKIMTGCAGEHFVAYKLSTMDYLVALTRGGSPSVDLMVGSPNGKKTVTIQVKTARQAFLPYVRNREKSSWYWHVGAGAQHLCGESVFYAFVDLRENTKDSAKSESMPDVFIVPADFVSKNLNNYPKPPQKPTDFWFDILEKDKGRWHEAWHLIRKQLDDDH